MKIHFHTQGGPRLASSRLRTYIPAWQLLARDHNVTMAACEDPGVDVVIFSKHFDAERMQKHAWRMKNQTGALVVMDICDDHFDRHHGDHYRKMIDLADVVTVNTEAMQARVKTVTGREAHVIRDPVEGRQRMIYAIRSEPRLLWYGHAVNLQGLINALPNLPNLPLDIVSSFAQETTNIEYPGTKLTSVRHIPWSQEAMPALFARSDIVILPVGKEPHNHTKSCNRAVEAIRAGKFVVAEPGIPDYERLNDFIWIGDLAEGIEWARNHSQEVFQKVRLGQDFITAHHDPAIIGMVWENVLMDAWRKRFATA